MVNIEDINKFVVTNYENGNGNKYESGYGYGDGDGSGYGDGYGNGNGNGYGDESGYGDGDESGYGYGDGDGSGYGNGNGCGNKYGGGNGFSDKSGYGDGEEGKDEYTNKNVIKSINGINLCSIDNINTLLTHIRNNIAQGFILNSDLSLTPCYIVKEGNIFAHGDTLHNAFNSLQEKLYKNLPIEDRIMQFKDKFPDFNKKYNANELFVWHNILTGSCKMGREYFCKNKGIDISKDKFTIYEFIELTKDSYGGEVVKKLL